MPPAPARRAATVAVTPSAMPAAPLPHEATLHAAITARVGVAYLVTWEDDRARRLVERLATAAFPAPAPCYLWSVTEGLTLAGKPVDAGRDLAAALGYAARRTEPALYLFRDAHAFLDDPVVRRAVRDCFRTSRDGERTIFFSGPRLVLPDDLTKEVMVFDLGLPGRDELERLVREGLAGSAPGATLAAPALDSLVTAVRGLTLDEAAIALRVAWLGREPGSPEALAAVIEFKRQVILKLGVLDFVPTRVRATAVGGLETLKAWLVDRQHALGAEARARNLPTPKGMLVMGVPGCGKSLSVQLVAGMWELPLLRLDLATLYSGRFGNPEASLQRALAVAEAVAPCVLWIDEIEKGIAGLGATQTGVVARVFGAFLTWMQEKTAPVFVGATANMIDLLPPEVLRKGRFDEIFFIDLPTPAERAAIWQVHLARLRVVPRKFPPEELAKMTEQWTASEIEQVVINAAMAALAEHREPIDHDLLKALGQIVPLSKTMSERIRQIRQWASDRAVPATARAH